MALADETRTQRTAALAVAPGDAQVAALLDSVRAGDADAIVAAHNALVTSRGADGIATMIRALEANGLADAMASALRRRARASDNLDHDAMGLGAAFLLVVTANARGDHQTALKEIADLARNAPSARDNPLVALQSAIAELGRKRPAAALAAIEPALEPLAAANLGFDALYVRAKALQQLPDRQADALAAWPRALAAARNASETDLARDGLIAELWNVKRFDECLAELDRAVAATPNPRARESWRAARAYVLAAKGDVASGVNALGELLAAASEPEQRLDLRLRQARMAVSGELWTEAAKLYDEAREEIAAGEPDAASRRNAVRLEKARVLATRDIDSVLADLDVIDDVGAPGWSPAIEIRLGGLLAAGRIDEAHEWLERRLARAPALTEHPAAFQMRAEIEFKRGNADLGMDYCARGAVPGPGAADPRAYGAALMNAFATQQWRAALDAYDHLAEVDPPSAESADARVIAASARLRTGDPAAALALSETAHPASPVMAAIRAVLRGEALLALGRVDQALAETKDALASLAPKSAEVPAEFFVALNTLRAQAFNERKDWAAAREAAGAAIAVPDRPGPVLQSMAAFVRIGAYLQRSIAHLRLGEQRAAHDDVDAAIAAHERLRGGAVLRLMAKAPEFDRLETSLWALKGRALEAESRIEEALAAYTRAAELERHGIEAAVLRGHALAATGAYAEALVVFETALARAAPGAEQADALSGKGGALVRLGQFEAAVAALQAALGARLTEPQNDPAVFELLGIAYEGLKRTGAANRAFRRAWDLTPEPKRSANLARGVSASELRLGNSKAARDFLAALPAHLTKDRTLLFNRALALDAVGERRAAIGCLVQAKDAGLDKAQEELDRLDAPAGLARWTSYWFGAQANRVRRVAGIALVAIAATIVAAPLVQWFVAGKPDWSLFMLPPLVALVLLALPSLKSVSVDAGKVKFTAEPLAATRREVAETAPEGFRIPTLTALPITPGGPLGGEHPGAPPPSLPRIKG